MKKDITTLVSAGGGIRCVTFIGVFRKIEELIKEKNSLLEKKQDDSHLPNININTVAGVSAGSMFGLMYILGYTSREMESEILHKKLEQLKDIRFVNFFNSYGIDSGNNIMTWIESLMIKKQYDKNITFEELYNKTKIDFQVFATNLNKYNFTKFNYVQTPQLKVTDAIRMSISIPFMFTITKYNLETKKMGDGDTHVDGGLIDSYPIYLFKESLDTTLGLKLVSHGEMNDHIVDVPITDVESYIYHVLACFMVQKDRKITLNQDYKDHTIFIDTQGITQTVNFGLSSSEKTKLINLGYKASTEYFENHMNEFIEQENKQGENESESESESEQGESEQGESEQVKE
jgi:predicted acylesterase/phospholipase RssA